jgi:hypothetical protein
MTLLLRRKLPTIVQNTLQLNPIKRYLFDGFRQASRVWLVCAVLACLYSDIQAQQWQPSRLPLGGQAERLPAASAGIASVEASAGGLEAAQGSRSPSTDLSVASEHASKGTVVLRWRVSSKQESAQESLQQPTSYSHSVRDQVSPAFSKDFSNPLRSHDSSDNPQWDNRPRNIQSAEVSSSQSRPRTVQQAQYRYHSGSGESMAQVSAGYLTELPDPLDEIEPAPQPPSILEGWSNDPPSFPRQVEQEESIPSRSQTEQLDTFQDLDLSRSWNQRSNNGVGQRANDEEDDLEAILRRAQLAATPDCDAQREQLRGQPLSTISLDVSPQLGDGLRAIKKKRGIDDDRRLQDEVVQRALRREWTDYRGNHLATGRLVDLQFGNVLLDDNGSRRRIPLVDLSDADWTYIAELWNLPFRCGSGYEPFEGREFLASTVQWKASGACHNPLYFEQVQLERYGHESGPLFQPLISSAHFLLTIPMLPYKMAINPPNECQYALGYHRPGDCAPYMMPPFPWSVRAGLVQAGFWTGTAALFP